MLLKQISIELKRHLFFFFGLSFVNIAIFLVSQIQNLSIVGNLISPFYLMIAFTLAVIYIFVDLYNDLYLGKNILSLMIPIDEIKIILAKSIAYTVGVMLLWLTTLLETLFGENGLYQTAVMYSDSKFEGIIYLISSRLFSVFSGIAIFVIIIALVRFFKNKFSSYIISFILFLMFTISFCCVVMAVNGCFDSVDWFIGINTDVHVYNQYFGFIPIMIVSSGNDISETINWGNLIMNISIGIFLFFLSSLILRLKKYDYLNK
ncbi:MAG: hypothetical protein LBM93_10800 [Oscillospiraceae bacterium]|jgi:hypothetical protein|nr:hypothetical protein [Oscillospiraceae bacterium]